MKVNLYRLYDMARGMHYDDFETVLKSTIAKVPNTVKIEGELICEITLEK